ncbi:solute carrier organic anion transporter family member 74D-like [Penaeus indicus]|uniref:solute carrier organic anion transporter family member 74D-like n=1 Tax=Penaeus indicus TaxID=29960 RepID=UPI00300C7E32
MTEKILIEKNSNVKIVNNVEKGNSKLSNEEQAYKILLDEEAIQDTRCGIGPFRSRWLQFLARKEVYLIVYCLVGLTNGMFFTYSVSVISTIEKRFKLTSKQMGTTLIGNDISQVILAIFLGYYGNFGHRPRWMGVGIMTASMSAFVAAIPHFIYGPGQDAIDLVEETSANLLGTYKEFNKTKKVELCYSQPEDTCNAENGGGGGSIIAPVIFLFFSQFLVGIAVSIFYSIGVTYLDDNINKKTYPIYYAATLLLRILGPVLGYLSGGKFLSMWIDPTYSPNLSKRDPRWLGAWWLGYLVIGSVLLISGNLLFLFPRKLPEAVRREAKKVARQVEKDAEEGGNRSVEYFAALIKKKKVEERPTLDNLRKALKRLFTNKIWMGNLFNTCTIVLAMSCYWNFKPKYLENQFRRSAAEANYYTGVASLASVSLGTALGGAIMRWVRPGPRFVSGYNIFITLFTCAGFIVLMFIGCEKLEIVGPVGSQTVPSCSSDCGCTDKFSPMCSEDQGTLYYSPCYAGCTVANTTVSPIAYSECSCITNATAFVSTPNPVVNISYTQDGQKSMFGGGTSSYCPEPCNSFFYYLIVQIVIKTVTATARVSSSVIHLRSVEDKDKGVALGALTAFLSCFGLIPGPIIMGAVIDSTCLLWDMSCGKRGNCWLYDSDTFRLAIHLIPAVFTFISVFGDIIVFYYSRQLDLYGERDNEIKEEKEAGETVESKPLNVVEEETIDSTGTSDMVLSG